MIKEYNMTCENIVIQIQVIKTYVAHKCISICCLDGCEKHRS